MLCAVEFGRLTCAAGRCFLHDLEEEENPPLILSPLLDEHGARAGVYAQLMFKSPLERSLDLHLFDDMRIPSPQNERKLDLETRHGPHSEPRSLTRVGSRIDLKESQIFQRFAEILPIGLAILDEEAEAVFVNDNFFKLTSNRDAKDFRKWPESIDPRDYGDLMSRYRDAFRSREPLRVEFRCVSSDVEKWRLCK